MGKHQYYDADKQALRSVMLGGVSLPLTIVVIGVIPAVLAVIVGLRVLAREPNGSHRPITYAGIAMGCASIGVFLVISTAMLLGGG